jgi:hypothetical protein
MKGFLLLPQTKQPPGGQASELMNVLGQQSFMSGDKEQL